MSSPNNPPRLGKYRIFALISCVAWLEIPCRLAGADLDVKHWQLFIDSYAIARGTGFDRVVHHPRAHGVVIPNDKPWETSGMNPLYFARKADGTFLAIMIQLAGS